MKSIKFDSITWYSKLLAVLVFLGIIPTLAFCFGRMYQKNLSIFEDANKDISAFSNNYVTVENTKDNSDCRVLSENSFSILPREKTLPEGKIPMNCKLTIHNNSEEIRIAIHQISDDTASIQITNKGIQQQINFRNFVETFSSSTKKYILGNDSINLSTDYNFDGYKDLAVITEVGASNLTYDFWFYEPTTKLFKKEKLLEGVSNPVFDSNKKTIASSVVRGVSGENNSSITYQFSSGKYTPVTEPGSKK